MPSDLLRGVGHTRSGIVATAVGIGTLLEVVISRGTESLQTHRWREVDSNCRSHLRARGLAFEQRPHRRFIDVVDRQALTGVEQLMRHRLAHRTDAEISGFHA